MNAPFDPALPIDAEAQAAEIEREIAAADDRLLSAIRSFEQSAIGIETDELTTERGVMIDYYMGRPFGNEIEGRSDYVSRDVYDTVEWIKPTLIRIFAGGEQIAGFEPQNENDVEGAKQESDYIDYIVQRKNPWFMLAHEWISDALMTRNAYALGYWDAYEAPAIERYRGLTDDQMTLIGVDPEVTIIMHSAYQVPVPLDPMQAGMLMAQSIAVPPITLHDIEVRRRREYGCAKLCILPPERCLVAQDARGMSVRYSDFFEYWDMKTISDLRADGFYVPDDISDAGGVPKGTVDLARDVSSSSPAIWRENLSTDPAMRKVRVRMIWLKHDYDGDGWSELRYVVAVGDNILTKAESGEPCNREVSSIPVACIVPNPMPHRHVGLTIFDAIADLQEIKSAIIREVVNNIHLVNNGRYGVDKSLVNLDDMAISRPGGMVRTQGPPANSIFPFSHPPMGAHGLAVADYFDAIRQDRGGVMKPMAGADVNAIMAQPGTVAQLTSAASQKIELIARVIGEGVKDLFSIVHEVTLSNATVADKVRLRGKWVTVDPRAWKRRSDMTLKVGYGLGNRAQQAAGAGALLATQEKAAGVGLTTPAKVYNALAEYVKALGYPSAEQFFVEPPPEAQFNPPPNPLIEATKIQEQGDALVQILKSNAAMAVESLKQENANARTYFETSIKEQSAAQERFLRSVSEATERMQELRIAGASAPAKSETTVQVGGIDAISKAAESMAEAARATQEHTKAAGDVVREMKDVATKKRKRTITTDKGKRYTVEDEE